MRPRSYRALRAQFTFHELAAWRDLAFDHVLTTLPDIHYLDLDEVENRVTVGIAVQSFEGTRAAVLRALTPLGVNPAAINFRSVSRLPRFDAAPGSLLSGGPDSIAGGMLINSYTANSSCSLGFVAVRNGQRGFVTNSHCTRTIFGLDYDSWFDQYFGATAQEIVDPNGYQCGLRTCRGADAVFAAAWTSAIPMALGKIRRTIGPNTGSQAVDQARGYFEIVSELADLVHGTPVNKIGYATGWTTGTVTGTCQDLTVSVTKVVRCTYGATYHRGEGDSGGPVFLRYAGGPDSGHVALVGVHSGTDWDGLPLFTKLDRIKSDLGGTWSVVDPNPTPYPQEPLTVVVLGPEDVQPGSACRILYTASARGGSNLFESWQWESDGVLVYADGSAAQIYFPSSGIHYVRVTVTDNLGATATDSRAVTVSTAGEWCTNF